MKIVGYIDGQRRFVRDEVTPQNAQLIAAHIKELADFHKKRLVLMIEHDNVSYMIKSQIKRLTNGEVTMTAFHSEFSDYPLADLPVMPECFADSSWHNDTCPSFIDETHGLRIFLDYVDPSKREMPESKRFAVMREDSEGALDCLFQSDDWQSVLAFVEQEITRIENANAEDNAIARRVDPHAICRKWVAKLGCGFHPDTRGKDYSPELTPDEVKEYDADMDRLFDAADPYECAVMAMADAGLC